MPKMIALPTLAPEAAICARMASAWSGFCEAMMFVITAPATLPKASWSGTPTIKLITPPMAPAIAPSTAPSPVLTGAGEFLM